MDDHRITFFVLDLLLSSAQTTSPSLSSPPRHLSSDYSHRHPQCYIDIGMSTVVANGNKSATVVHIGGPKQQVLAAKADMLREMKRRQHRVIEIGQSIANDDIQSFADIARRCAVDFSASHSSVARSTTNIRGSSSIDPATIATIRDRYNSQDSQETAVARSPDRLTFNTRMDLDGWVEENGCGIVLTGAMENVEDAYRAMLVQQDKAEGLHLEVCDIDYKLQLIIAGRQGHILQTIQEQTGTNIYFSVPLVGVFNDPPLGHHQGEGYKHLALQPPPPTNHPHSYQARPPPFHGPPGRVNDAYTGPIMPNLTGTSRMTDMSSQAPSVQMMEPRFMNGPQFMNGDHRGHHQMNGPPRLPPNLHPNHPNVHHMSPGTQQRPPMHHLGHPGGQPPFRPPHGQSFGQHGSSHPPPQQAWQPAHHYPHHNPYDHRTGFQGNNRAMPHNGPPSIQMQHTGVSSVSIQPSRINSPLPYAQVPMNHQPGSLMPPSFSQSHMPRPPFAGPPQPQMPARPMGPPRPQNHARLPPHPVDCFAGVHPGFYVHNGEHGDLHKANQVVITGDQFNIQRAVTMLKDMAVQKANNLLSRDINIHPRKLDWILTERLEELRKIMSDNATYVQVPSVGSGHSLITVFGDYHVNIYRTIASIVALACTVHQASIFLLADNDPLDSCDVQDVLKTISVSTGVEAVYKSKCFEVNGLGTQVQSACRMILDLEAVQGMSTLVKFQIEASAERRDFITGKKNGKFNTISKTAKVDIKTENLNDHNFLIELSGAGHAAVQGAALLSGELPAEISFFIPQQYHKEIIGVRGSHVQTIMNKFDVYIHCADRDEQVHRGGYLEIEDNTYIQCPAKNLPKLALAKAGIMDLVADIDKNFLYDTVSIPRRHHRVLLSEKSIFLRSNGQNINQGSNRFQSGGDLITHRCKIRFPAKESGSDQVILFGPESSLPLAKDFLLSQVPYEAELRVPSKAGLEGLVASTEFADLVEKIRTGHQISVRANLEGDADADKEGSFKFKCQMNHKDHLVQARKMLVQWLKGHNIETYGTAEEDIPEEDESQADPEPFTNGTNGHETATPTRTGVASKDVQALFEGSDYNPHGNGEGTGFAGPLAFPNGRRPDHWPAPIQPPATAVAPSRADILRRDTDPLNLDSIHPVIPRHRPGAHSQRGIASRTLSYDVASDFVSRTFLGGHPLASGPSIPRPNATSAQTASGQPLHHNTTVGGRFSIDAITKGMKDTTMQ